MAIVVALSLSHPLGDPATKCKWLLPRGPLGERESDTNNEGVERRKPKEPNASETTGAYCRQKERENGEKNRLLLLCYNFGQRPRDKAGNAASIVGVGSTVHAPVSVIV